MGRPARAEVVAEGRKRRNPQTLDRVHHMKLALPVECQNDPAHYYYWANDDTSRIADLTLRGEYDHVILKGPEADDQDRVRRQVGVKDGKPLYAYLLRQPMEFRIEDQMARAAVVSKKEEDMVKAVPSEIPQSAGAYVVPGSGISRRTGQYAP